MSRAERWVSVIEPVMRNTLINTAMAQLETLTTLCGSLTFGPGDLAWIEEYSWDLLRGKMFPYADGIDRQNEVALALSRAKFYLSIGQGIVSMGKDGP